MTGLGMRLEREAGGRGPSMTTVESIVQGFAAHRSGRIMVGDILE
jgi:hypothetical protein